VASSLLGLQLSLPHSVLCMHARQAAPQPQAISTNVHETIS
jgi:hypothetical protein